MCTTGATTTGAFLSARCAKSTEWISMTPMRSCSAGSTLKSLKIGRLAHLDSHGDDGSNEEDWLMALREYFYRWVGALEDKGELLPDAFRRNGRACPSNPRFCVCLVLDSESVALLVGLPEELPPLRCAVDGPEKQRQLSAGEGAWVWPLEVDFMAKEGARGGTLVPSAVPRLDENEYQ
ncbi:hypothetical protein N657DRAFT_462980 [Parathielavia appendiculata]|uniref:Uncharacterized protein n=1 Tax=Parathielavia appendiculata TaxID=2587402 RepID=A0AAN6Z450_9PEZI|nr:hypothetical protein N657DRAFT_462980 [Parathielavia appendiculata]